MGEFFGGLARGLNQGFAIGQQRRQMEEQRRSREEQLRLQQQKLQQQEQQFQQQHGLEREKFDWKRELETLQQEHEQQKFMLEKKQHELALVGEFEKASRPGQSKARMKFNLNQLFRAMPDVDHTSKEVQEVIATLIAVSDEERKELVNGMLLFYEQADPGELEALIGAAARQEIPLSKIQDGLLELHKQSFEQQKHQDEFGLKERKFDAEQEQFDRTQGLEERKFEAGQERDQMLLQLFSPQAGAEGAADDPGAAAQQQAEALNLFGPEGRAISNFRQEVDPVLVQRKEEAKQKGQMAANQKAPFTGAPAAIVGFQGQNITKGQAYRMGIFVDELSKEPGKQLKEISDVEQLTKRIDTLREKIDGRPELLGMAGSVIRNVNSLFATIQGLTNLVPGTSRLNISLDGITDNPTIKGMMDRNLSGDAAVVQSQIIGLAYELATANKTGRLNERDIERALMELGQSANPDAFTDVLSFLENHRRGAALSELEMTTGFPSVRLLPLEDLEALYDNPAEFLTNESLLPEDIEVIEKAVNRELQRRLR